MRSLSLGKKLAATFAVTIVLSGGLAGYLVNRMGEVHREGDRLYTGNYRMTAAAYEADLNLLRENRALLRLFLAKDEAARREQAKVISENDAEFNANLDKVKATAEADELAGIAAIRQAHDQLSTSLQRAADLALAGDVAGAEQFNASTVRPQVDALTPRILDLLKGDAVDAENGHRQTSAMYALARNVGGGLFLVVVILNVTLAILIGRRVTRAIRRNAQDLGQASLSLTAGSTQLSSTAERTEQNAGAVAAASDEVTSNVQLVASAIEEMNISAHEIAESASRARQVASEGVEKATRTNATVARLKESSTEIGEVLDVITSIAEQTNLLALNATIEAARAGDAGKGFAVVAGEVKDLAKQTAAATGDIAARINAIQSDTADALAEITEIGETIATVNELQTTIAGAVEEQTATTSEIGHTVNDVAAAVQRISESIATVAADASDTLVAAEDGRRTAASLTSVVAELSELVDGKGVAEHPRTSAFGGAISTTLPDGAGQQDARRRFRDADDRRDGNRGSAEQDWVHVR